MEKEEINFMDELPQNPQELSSTDHQKEQVIEDFDEILEEDDADDEGKDQSAPSSAQEVQDLKDKYLRLLAEFENYKKRTTKERIEFAKYASQEMVASLLTILDDFDRTAKHGHSTEGSQLIHTKLLTMLKQKGLNEMISTGEVFDPSLHEAITELPVAEDQKNKIIDTVEKGYYLSDKIIRYAKVVVGK